MEIILIKELELLEKKARIYFKEAEADNNPSGGGFFYLSKKISLLLDKLKGYKTTEVQSLREIQNFINKEISPRGKYSICLSVEIEDDETLSFGGRLFCNFDHSRGEYISRRNSVTNLLTEITEMIDKDIELRSGNDDINEDITVK
jgi:hypothetical protein